MMPKTEWRSRTWAMQSLNCTEQYLETIALLGYIRRMVIDTIPLYSAYDIRSFVLSPTYEDHVVKGETRKG